MFDRSPRETQSPDWGGRSGRRLVRRRTAGRAALVLTCALAVAACGIPLNTPAPTIPPTPSPSPTAVPRNFPTPPPIPTSTPLPTPQYRMLKDYAGTRYFGTAVRAAALRDDERYAALTETEFSSITPEYAMLWSYTEKFQGEPDYSDADNMVAWAASRGIKVRGFTLAWNKGLPAWLENGNFDKPTLTQILHDHITNEVSHFAGKVVSWDVVNEPLAGNAAGSLRNSIWLRTLGPDYIAQVLQWAHTADPAAKLYINETAVEGLTAKSDQLYALAKSLKARGIPLDGVGFEGHMDASDSYVPPAMASNIQRFGQLGLEVAFTEMDVRTHVPPLEKEPPRQRNLYRTAIKACFSQPACVGVTVWEFSDRYSWIPSTYPGMGEAGLFNDKLSGKWELLPIVMQAMTP